MSDLIERQAAIDKINERQRKLIYCFGFENDVVKIMDIAKSIVIAIPSVQPEPFVDADKLKKCRFEYINACKTVTYPTPDTRKNDIYDAYAVIKALRPIFGDEEF